MRDIKYVDYHEYYTVEEAMKETKNLVSQMQKNDISCEVSIQKSIYKDIISYCVTIIGRDNKMPSLNLPNPNITMPKF